MRHRTIGVAWAALLLGLIGLAGAACGGSEARETLNQSLAGLEDAHSFTMRVDMTVASLDQNETARVETESAYESRELVYSISTVRNPYDSPSPTEEYLLLLPDLYLRQSGEQWYVQSPWNQGIKASELPDPESQDPINIYKGIVDRAYDLQVGDPADMDSVPHLHVVGKLDANTDFSVWIRSDNKRPSRLEITGDDPAPWDSTPATNTVIEFASFDETAVLPAAPENVRPIRDLQLPAAPCTGDGFQACTAAQTQLESDGLDACEGGTSRRICVMPLGQIDPAIATDVVDYFRTEYGLDITLLPPAAVPPQMADSLREQVDSRQLIDYMMSKVANVNDPNMVLIGLTPLDIYDSDSTWRYVFGLKGNSSDPKAVISTFRMDPITYGEPGDRTLTLERTRKLFSKYVGLLYYDLPVSDDSQSVMYNSILGPDDLDAMTEPLQVPQ